MKDLFEFAGFQLSYFPTLNGALKGATPASEQQGAVVLATPDTVSDFTQNMAIFAPLFATKLSVFILTLVLLNIYSSARSVV